jgi:menaquinol-cytochrome c reductase iron-sulfur subunit
MSETKKRRLPVLAPAGDAQANQEREEKPGQPGFPEIDDVLPPERRRLLSRLALAIGTVGAVLVGVPFVAFIVSPVRRREAQVWRAVGRLEEFPLDRTVKVTFENPAPRPWAGASGHSAAWLRREADGALRAFSVYCTHTACPVRWDEGANLFLCPCHGGAFYASGAVAAGPPPRPLATHEVRVRDGVVEILTLPVPAT